MRGGVRYIGQTGRHAAAAREPFDLSAVPTDTGVSGGLIHAMDGTPCGCLYIAAHDPSHCCRARMSRIRAALDAYPLLVDGAIALGLTLLTLFAVAAGAPDVGPGGAVNLVLLLLQTVPLVARRRAPLIVFVVVVAALVLQVFLLPDGGVLRSSGGPLVAFYTLGAELERRRSFPIAFAVGVILGVLMVQHAGLPQVLQPLIQTELFLLAAWYVGDSARIRGLYTRALEAQADLVEREREQRAQRAIAEERERIARELHDAVTHHVSVIVIQAGAGLRALARRPSDAESALTAIDVTGRQALTDMRRMLGILGDGEAEEPMPRLDRLGDLLEQVRAAGLGVELAVHGERRPLDPGLELSAYRIIQEALTNSLKHAGGGRARVTVRYEPDALGILVEDERGPEARPSVEPEHDGRGLVGMRERVAMFRGSFAAQPTGVGWRVSVELPVDRASGA